MAFHANDIIKFKITSGGLKVIGANRVKPRHILWSEFKRVRESRESRTLRRHREFYSKLDLSAYMSPTRSEPVANGFVINLTLPDEYEEEYDTFVSHLHEFRTQMRKMLALEWEVTKLSSNKNDRPHFHGIIGLYKPDDLDRVSRWVARTWYELTGLGNQDALIKGTYTYCIYEDKDTSFIRLTGYFAGPNNLYIPDRSGQRSLWYWGTLPISQEITGECEMYLLDTALKRVWRRANLTHCGDQEILDGKQAKQELGVLGIDIEEDNDMKQIYHFDLLSNEEQHNLMHIAEGINNEFEESGGSTVESAILIGLFLLDAEKILKPHSWFVDWYKKETSLKPDKLSRCKRIAEWYKKSSEKDLFKSHFELSALQTLTKTTPVEAMEAARKAAMDQAQLGARITNKIARDLVKLYKKTTYDSIDIALLEQRITHKIATSIRAELKSTPKQIQQLVNDHGVSSIDVLRALLKLEKENGAAFLVLAKYGSIPWGTKRVPLIDVTVRDIEAFSQSMSDARLAAISMASQGIHQKLH